MSLEELKEKCDVVCAEYHYQKIPDFFRALVAHIEEAEAGICSLAEIGERQGQRLRRLERGRGEDCAEAKPVAPTPLSLELRTRDEWVGSWRTDVGAVAAIHDLVDAMLVERAGLEQRLADAEREIDARRTSGILREEFEQTIEERDAAIARADELRAQLATATEAWRHLDKIMGAHGHVERFQVACNNANAWLATHPAPRDDTKTEKVQK